MIWSDELLMCLLGNVFLLLGCCCLVTKSCLTLCDLMDSFVHVTSQARIMECVVTSFSDPGIEPMPLALAGGLFTVEPPGKP